MEQERYKIERITYSIFISLIAFLCLVLTTLTFINEKFEDFFGKIFEI